MACETAAADAERAFDLPSGLLRAIGLIELGRWERSLNRSTPWPYAIDAGGYDLYMESLADAVAQVQSLRRQGLQIIDVGCFQINLFFHPDAFSSLEEAFDPVANARYAARFLIGLRERTGSWDTAVAWYHSAVPELGEPYRAKVFAAWQGTAQPSGPSYATAAFTARPFLVPPTMSLAGFGPGYARPFAGVRVITPELSDALPPILRTAVRVVVPSGSLVSQSRQPVGLSRGRLPLVFSPTSRPS